MSKYDFELDLDSENSLSIMIDMIKPNSKVLEFGPANGRMTRYLSEKMDCQVDIVEIDNEAGLEASQYSNRSFLGTILGDVEKFKWLEELKNEKYDYIVFADVLEHLHIPMKVLKICNRILKDNGSIIISVPNIAHNSVIIDLINDEFKYNEIGLLDNTHISFFTYKSLIRMIQECGYKTVIERATYCKVGENEISNNYNSVNKQIAKELRKRDNGNLYQFIFELKKKEYVITKAPMKKINLDINSEYELVCYVKERTDNNFSETKTIRKFINPNHNLIEFEFSDFKEISALRIDPITTNCLVDIRNIYTVIEDKKVDINILYTNGINIVDSIYIFSNNDPQIYLDLKNMNIQKVYYECVFIDYDSDISNEYELIFQQIIKNKNETLKEKDNIIMKLESIIQEKQNIIESHWKVIEEKEKRLKEIQNSRGWKYIKKIKRVIGK